MRRALFAAAGAATIVAGVAGLPGSAVQAQGHVFVPKKFFSGVTEGTGSVKIVLHKARAIHVRSVGRVEPDGTLVLDQRVEQEGEKPMQRQWRLREGAGGQVSGSLSDAKTPVTGKVAGPVLTLSYQMKSGEKVAQVITLAPDGQSALNKMTIHRFGLKVATLEETIRRK